MVPVPTAAAKPAPVTASIAPLSPPVPAATAPKKGKPNTAHQDRKSREDEIRRVRQDMVQKLKFQNSFDTAPKARLPKPKDHEKAHVQSQPTQVQIGQYRNSKEAQAKVAELQKKGIKATVRTAKDSKGTLYVVCKPGVAQHADTEKLAKKPEKSSGVVKKPKIE
jgi:cell division protein FtsN